MKHDQPLTDTQRAIVEDNLHLIKYALARVPVYLFDSREDAYQIGAIGLIKAARSFDSTKNVLFATYASRCIINELLMAVRKILSARANRCTCSLDAPVMLANGESMTLADLILSNEPEPEEVLSVQASLEEITRSLRAIPDCDTLRIIHMVLAGTKQAEMAALLGCTQSGVSRKLSRIRTALKNSMT